MITKIRIFFHLIGPLIFDTTRGIKTAAIIIIRKIAPRRIGGISNFESDPLQEKLMLFDLKKNHLLYMTFCLCPKTQSLIF
jgi:hypothetical protein